MVYVDFTAGNKDYKLRLNTRNTIALEKNLLDSENRLQPDAVERMTFAHNTRTLCIAFVVLYNGIKLFKKR